MERSRSFTCWSHVLLENRALIRADLNQHPKG